MNNTNFSLFFFFLCITSGLVAQESLATFNGGGIRVDGGINVRVENNVFNEGNVRLEPNAIIYIHGSEWSNHTIQSTGAGDVPGDGWVYFIKDASSVTGPSLQLLDGNNQGVKGTGPSFPRIKILNIDNIQLEDNGTRVRAQVDFAVNDGHIITNYENVYMSSTANFTQFTELKYVVTDGTPTTGGYVRKENLVGSFVYPIGTAENDYTPATLTNTGTSDCYDGRVFNNTFLDGTSGVSWNPNTVAKTWRFEEAVAGGSNVNLNLQHNSPTNGADYDPLNAYVTNYIGSVGNTNGGAPSPNKWDLMPCPSTKAEVSPGTMTTGAPIAQGLMLDRVFTDLKNYPLFTKNSNEFPNITTNMTPDNCNASGTGTATATGSMGILPYTYEWNNGQTTQTATGLTAGTYTVTLSDIAGCETIGTIVVTQNPAITLTVSNSNVTCNSGQNGSATAIASGGTPAFQYVWSDGQTTVTATGLTAGVYTVSVTDATGCLRAQSVTITEAEAITLQFNVTNVPCDGTNNGTATVTPSQGNSPFTYLWSANANGQMTQTATGLAAGTYIVTVTDNSGCVVVDNVIVNQNSNIALTLTGTNITCYNGQNGSATATATSGTPPFQYVWSNGQTTVAATNLTAGVYTVSVADATGCTRIESITISEPAEITVQFNVLNVACNSTNNGSATATPSQGVSPFVYEWSTNANGQTTQTATGLTAGTYTVTITDDDGCEAIDVVTVGQNAAITLNVTGTNTTCNSGQNGTATANANGGTPPLQYTWSSNANGQTTQTATGLTAGTYTVSVTDITGCLQTQSIVITEPAAISVQFNVSNVACNSANNGSATATPSQGTSPYTYEWNNGQMTQTATGLSAATYIVTITDSNGCEAIDNVVVAQNASITLGVSGTNTTCNSGQDGTATATANGGTPPLQYTWSDGQSTTMATGLAAGTYTVSVTDITGCIETQSVIVGEPSAINVQFNVSNVACNSTNNGSATATPAQGSSPYSYNWDAGANGQMTQTATGLAAGTYTVTITDDDGCQAIDNVTVAQNAAITLNVTGTNTTCNSGQNGAATANANGGTPPLQYTWTPNANGQTTQTITGLSAGTYTVSVTDITGCLQTQSVTITEPDAISVQFNVSNVGCSSTNNGTATATPSQGTSPYTYNWNDGQMTQTATGLSAATYIVTITDSDGCIAIDNVTVTQNAAITLSTSGSITTCNGGQDGSAVATASGGTPPLQYNWSTNANGQTTATVTGLTAGTYTVSVTDVTGCLQTESVTVTEPTAGTIQFNVTNVSCDGTNNGTASASPSQGSTPFSFEWDTNANGQTTQTATGLSVGTYTVTITDNDGCETIDNVTVNQNAAISLNVSSSNTTCNSGQDGTATATGSGGTPPLQYTWSANANGQTTPTATGLTAGTYTVAVSDVTGCLQTQSVTVGEPAVVTIQFNVINAPCDGTNNGEATANPSQGNTPFTYVWSANANGQTTQTATGLLAGTYTVTVTDNDGCVTIDDVIVSQNSSIALTINGSDVTCYSGQDGMATATASGGTPPFQYIWSNAQTTIVATNLTVGTYTVSVSDATSCIRIESITINEPNEMTVLFNVQDVACNSTNNGTATASPSEGTAPYTYEWSDGQMTPTASGLTAGTYTVTITDNDGCEAIDNIAVNQNPSITLNATVTNVTCNSLQDGTASAVANGGTLPFQYIWSNGQTTATSTGLNQGTYTVSVSDASGCLETQSVTITEPPAITVQFNVLNVGCNSTNDGTATATPSQGTSPYSYEWSDGQTTQTASGLTAAVYTVTITDDNGCEAIDNITVSQNAAIALTVSGANANCNGSEDGTATATATGGTPPLQYIWSANANGQTTTTATGLPAGTYTVSVTDVTGCLQTQSVTITEPDYISAIFTITDVACDSTDNGSVMVSNNGGVSPVTYQWDGPAGNQTGPMASGLTTGVYIVTLTDATGCSVAAGVIVDEADCNPCPADYCTEVLSTNADICVLINADPNSPLADLDCDGDGVTNADECTDGTDPLDPCDYYDTSITLPVIADQTACPMPCPDLANVMTILPGNIAGVSNVDVAVQISELDSVDTDGSFIIVRIPSDPRLTFTWDPTLTQAALVPILNADWNYLGNNGFVHTWSYNGPGVVIPARGGAAFGFKSVYDPQATDGQTTLTATILPFSGGECNLLNNTDSERMVYFE